MGFCHNLFLLLKEGFVQLWYPPPGEREATLDGIRALAAIWVVALHSLVIIYDSGLFIDPAAGRYLPPPGMVDFLVAKGSSFIWMGSLGVDMFFVLSGYLIMNILVSGFSKLASNHPQLHLSQEASREQPHQIQNERSPLITPSHSSLTLSPDPFLPPLPPPRPTLRELLGATGKFLGKRYFRIMPAYIFFLIIYYISFHDPSCAKVWANFLFINNYYSAYEGTCFGWSWSIAVEFQMYLVSPIFAWVATFHPRWSYPLLFTFAAISMGLALGFGISDPEEVEGIIYYFTPFRIHAYFLGMLAALHIRKERREMNKEGKNPIAYRNVILVWTLRLIALGLIFWGAMFVPFSEKVGTTKDLAMVVFVPGLVWIMYDLISPMHQDDFFRKALNWFLSSKVMYLFAQLSYSIYLVHLIFMLSMYDNIRNWFGDWDWNYGVYLLIFIFYLTLSSFTAAFAFVFVEKPFIKLGNYLFGRRE